MGAKFVLTINNNNNNNNSFIKDASLTYFECRDEVEDFVVEEKVERYL